MFSGGFPLFRGDCFKEGDRLEWANPFLETGKKGKGRDGQIATLHCLLKEVSERPEGVYLHKVRYRVCISLLRNHCQDPLLYEHLKRGDLFIRLMGRSMINRNEFFIVVFLILMALLTACAKHPSRASALGSPGIEESVSEVPSTFENSDFLLGPEDVLDVLVWKNDDLSRSVAIRPDGKISLPLIGDVLAGGLTSSQLRNAIQERLREYKETPEVSIIIKEVNSFSVFVLGEVARPGKFQLRSETTLLQALTLSGGFTQYAALDKIILLRRVAGRETRMRIRFSDIVDGKDPDANVVLQRGDTIVVP